jgi:hypothetical protein
MLQVCLYKHIFIKAGYLFMQLYYVYNAVSLLDAPKDSFIDGVIILP